MIKKNHGKLDRRKTGLLLFALLIFSLFLLLTNQRPWRGSSIRSAPGTIEYRENPWVLRRGDTVIEQDITLPEYRHLDSGTLYTLSTRLTYDGSQDPSPYVFFHLDHLYCKVLLDGKVLFSCMPEDIHKPDSSKSPGFIYKALPLPRDCVGKELEIQMLPPLTASVEYGLPDIQFGDFLSAQTAALRQTLPHNSTVLLCAVFGILSILLASARLRGSEYREGLNIGIFALLFALYLVTESKLNCYYLGNPYHTYLLNYIPFSLLPVALMGFMRERFPEKHRKVCSFLIGGELLFFIVEAALHFSGILDLKEILPAVHAVYTLDLIAVFGLILAMRDRKKKHALLLQLLPVAVGMLVDVIIYWRHLQIGINDATFMILGVTIFLIIELVRIWKNSMVIYTESIRSSIYHRMAYIDELTGIGNRRAYEEEIRRITAGECDYDSLIVVSSDVNKLKIVNDRYGHAAGDKLIRGAAKIMTDVTGDRGKVFRTGGDEFCAFLYNVEMPEYESMFLKAIAMMEQFNAENEFTMSIAAGHVQIRDHRILEATRAADKNMYADKARQEQTQSAL